MRLKRLIFAAVAACAAVAMPAVAASATTAAPAAHVVVHQVTKPAYSDNDNITVHNDGGSGYLYAASNHDIYTATSNTHWDFIYVGTVSGGTLPGFGGEFDGDAYYVTYQHDTSNCIYSASFEQALTTNCGSSTSTFWIATPAYDGDSGHYSFVNIGDSRNANEPYCLYGYGNGDRTETVPCADDYLSSISWSISAGSLATPGVRH